MPDTQQLQSVDQFADKIKTKYPVYQELDNKELVDKIVAKYPVYKDQIDFGPTPEEQATLDQEAEDEKQRQLSLDVVNDVLLNQAGVPQELHGILSSVNQSVLGLVSGPAKFVKELAFGLDSDVQEQLKENPEAITEVWDNYWNGLDSLDDFGELAGSGTKAAELAREGKSTSISELAQQGNIADAAELTVEQVAGGAVSLIPTFFGPWGAAFLGVGAAGSAFDEDVHDEEKVAAVQEDGGTGYGELLGASLAKGGVEFASELVTAGIVGRAKKMARAGASEQAVKEYINTTLKGTWAQGFGEEFLAEGLADTGNKIVDELFYGTEHDAIQVARDFFDNGLIGGIIGGKVALAGYSSLPRRSKAAVNQATKPAEHIEAEKEDQGKLKNIQRENQKLEQAVKDGDPVATAVLEANNKKAKEVVDQVIQRNKDHADKIEELGPEELKDYAKAKDKADKLKKAKEKAEKDGSEDSTNELLDEQIADAEAEANRVYTAPEREAQAAEAVQKLEDANEVLEAELEDASKPQTTADGKAKPKTKKQKLQEKDKRSRVKENNKLIKEAKKEGARPKKRQNAEDPRTVAKLPRKERVAANLATAQDANQPTATRNKAFNRVLEDNAQERGAVKKSVKEKLFNQRGIKLDDATIDNFIQAEISKLVKNHDPSKGASLGSRILHPNFAKNIANKARAEAQAVKTQALGSDLQAEKQAELDDIKQQVVDGILDPEAAEILKDDIEREYGTGALGTSIDAGTDAEGETIIPKEIQDKLTEGPAVDQDSELDLINKLLGGQTISDLLKDIPGNRNKIFALLPNDLKTGSAFSGIFKEGNPDVAIWESYFDDRKRKSVLKKQLEKRLEEAKTPPSTDIDPKDAYDGAVEFMQSTNPQSDPSRLLPLLGKLKRSFPGVKIIISKAKIIELLIEGGYDPGKADNIRGMYANGNVYLNPTLGLDAETPIHEFGHIWAKATKRLRPELYAKGSALIKKSAEWRELQTQRNNPDSVYFNYTDAQLIEEAMATAIGKHGAEIFEAKADQSQWDKLRKQILDWVGSRLGITAINDLTLDQFIKVAATEIVTGELAIPNAYESINESLATEYLQVPVGTTRNYARNTPPVKEFDTHGSFKGAKLGAEVQPALDGLQQGEWIGWTTGKYDYEPGDRKYNKNLQDRIQAKVDGMRKWLDGKGYKLKQDPVNPGYHQISHKPNFEFSEATPEGKNTNDLNDQINKNIDRGLRREGDYGKSAVTAKTRKVIESTAESFKLYKDQLSYDQLQEINNKIKTLIAADYQAQRDAKNVVRDNVNNLITETSDIDASQKVSKEDIEANNTIWARAKRIKLSNILAPASNNDFYGLLYSFLPKGKGRADAQKFIDNYLLTPLEDANIEYTRMTHDLRANWKTIKDKSGVTGKLLQENSTVTLRTGQKTASLLTNSQVVKLYNYIKDPDPKLRQQLVNTGVTDVKAQEILDYVDSHPNLKEFAEGIPSIYASVAKDINDKLISHGYEGFDPSSFYTPLTVDSDTQHSYDQEIEKAVIGGPGIDLYSVMSGRLKKRRGGGQIDLTKGVEQDFESYLQGPPRTAAFLDFSKDASAFFGAKQLKAVEASYGKAHADAIRDSLFRIISGRTQPNKIPESVKSFDRFVNKAVSSVLFINPRSAILQLLSTANYLFDDPSATYRGATSGNYTEAARRISESPWFKERGQGKIDVALADFFAGQSKTTVGKLSDFLLEKGYFLTKAGDKAAILTGGAAYAAGKFDEYSKQGLDPEKAWDKALRDFVKQSEAAQQSTRAERLGSQQTTRTGKLLLAFANTPMQYNRKMAKAIQDIRGYGITSPEGKRAAVKIAYYGAAQNVIFNTLQQLSFSLLGLGDGEDDEKEALNILNSIANTILRGMGIYGAAFAAVKDAIKAVVVDKRKGLGAVTESIVQVSPAVSTKIRHLRTALGDRDPKVQSDLNLSKSTYQIAAAAEFANIPLDRALKLIEQGADIAARDLEDYQKLLRALGWSRYNLGKQLEKAEGPGLLGGDDQYY